MYDISADQWTLLEDIALDDYSLSVSFANKECINLFGRSASKGGTNAKVLQLDTKKRCLKTVKGTYIYGYTGTTRSWSGRAAVLNLAKTEQ